MSKKVTKKVVKENEPTTAKKVESTALEKTSQHSSDTTRLTRAQKVRSWSVVNAIVCGAAVIGLGTVLTIKLVNHFASSAVAVNFATRDDSVTIVGPKTVYIKKNTKFSDFNKPVATSTGHSFAYWTMSDDKTPIDTDYIVNNGDTFYAVMTPGPIELFDGVYSYLRAYGQWGKLTINHSFEPEHDSLIQFTLENNDEIEMSRRDFNEPIVIGGKCARIPDYFLSYCVNFNQQVFIPSSVKEVGNYFMSHCTTYTQPISIPDNVSVIGDNFMLGCTRFNQDFRITYDLTKIGNHFLEDCVDFNSDFIFPKNSPLPKFEEIGDNFLSGCKKFNKSLSGIPNTVRKIGSNFLSGCEEFTQAVHIPTSLVEFGDNFLSGCESFNKAIEFNCVNLTAFPNNFMKDCSHYNNEVKIKSKIVSIGDGFMQGCIAFDHTFVYNLSSKDDPQNAFANVTSIGKDFLRGCTSYTGEYKVSTATYCGLRLPKQLQSFGTGFLQGCDNLKQLEINFNVYDTNKSFPAKKDQSVVSTTSKTSHLATTGVKLSVDVSGEHDQNVISAFTDCYEALTSGPNYRKYNTN